MEFPKAERPWGMKMQVIPEDGKPWKWTSSWASGEDSGQNNKGLSYMWDWEGLTLGGTMQEGTRCPQATTARRVHPHPLLSAFHGHLCQSKCCPKRAMWVRWRGQIKWVQSCLSLPPAVWPGAVPHLKWGKRCLSPKVIVRKKGNCECPPWMVITEGRVCYCGRSLRKRLMSWEWVDWVLGFPALSVTTWVFLSRKHDLSGSQFSTY